ncbi:membrane-bound lytic murein transglycosylase B [Desulfurispira natronophila]|uniref:Membrane-bound lytic murein transglycosylase B n=2 Tax=Desulfurispira natronophila TaxID=682562 RepID=A0A7W7Y546_9BACT|nr:membrane-bound lytic murein transglycosylase B [Desulfurispira natronophila]
MVLAMFSVSNAEDTSFEQCLNRLKSQAANQGFSPSLINDVFSQVNQREQLVKLDRSQAEFTETFWQYLQNRVTSQRVERGRELLQEHGPLLRRIAADYGVRPEYLLAFWGMETNYGTFFGNTPVFDALTTLACDGRREEFFSTQLMHALSIVQEGSVEPERMRGSWAGAMGHTQFMPSTFTAYAVDYDGNGRRDLWNSLPDAFASSANYLSSMGWRDGERWGREVYLPDNFDYSQADLGNRQPLSYWRQQGVTQVDGKPVANLDMPAAVILPQGHQGPAFVVYHNFHLIMRWNRSVSFALAVGHLSDRIAGMGNLATSPPSNEEMHRLSRSDVKELQQRLADLGLYNHPEATGTIGPETRNATRRFQQLVDMPADAYPTRQILERLREVDVSGDQVSYRYVVN